MLKEPSLGFAEGLASLSLNHIREEREWPTHEAEQWNTPG
jgi:hypothetical protein